MAQYKQRISYITSDYKFGLATIKQDVQEFLASFERCSGEAECAQVVGSGPDKEVYMGQKGMIVGFLKDNIVEMLFSPDGDRITFPAEAIATQVEEDISEDQKGFTKDQDDVEILQGKLTKLEAARVETTKVKGLSDVNMEKINAERQRD